MEAHFGGRDQSLCRLAIESNACYMNRQHGSVLLTYRSSNNGNIGHHLSNHLRGFPLSIYDQVDEDMFAYTLKGGTKYLYLQYFVEVSSETNPQLPHYVYVGQAHELEGSYVGDDYGYSCIRVNAQQEN